MDEARRRAMDCLREIESAFANLEVGPNLGEMARIQGLCYSIQVAGSYISDKKNKLLSLTEDFFSAGKWQKHGPDPRGVRLQIGRTVRSLQEALATSPPP